jgi:hypothetical protein
VAATIFLEAEDEITGAVSRIRGLEEREAVLVLAPGSRIGTSRINFKLLAREAERKGLSLTTVSDEPSVRALAISAGLPAYDSVSAAESGLQELRRQVGPREPRAGRGSLHDPGKRQPTGDATRVMSVPRLHEPDVSRRRAAEPVAEAEVMRREPRRRRLPIAPVVLLLLLVAVVAAGVYAAYLYLPTATITLRPVATEVGPLTVIVSADPNVAVADAAEGVIPAERLEVPLVASGEFPASGRDVRRTTASGVVVFESTNTFLPVAIPRGTTVSTSNGIEFQTTESATLERANFETGPSTVEVPIEAVNPGQRGNVPAHSIRQVPDDLAAVLVAGGVDNPEPTSGGRRIEQRSVTEDDYAAAVEELDAMLATELEAGLADPATTPRGLTIFPASARIGESFSVPPADQLVGTQADTFSLSVEAPASVLAVNEALVDQVVEERLRLELAGTHVMTGEGSEASRGSGVVVGAVVVYRATATARAYTEPDRDMLLAEIRGKPISEARTILGRHGTVEITIWPDFIDRIPDQLARVNLSIEPPREDP